MRGPNDFYNHCAQHNFDASDFIVASCTSQVQKVEAVVKMMERYDSREGAGKEEAGALHKNCKHTGKVAAA
jgi:hypothetical protein